MRSPKSRDILIRGPYTVHSWTERGICSMPAKKKAAKKKAAPKKKR